MRSRGNTFWAVSPSPFDFYVKKANVKKRQMKSKHCFLSKLSLMGNHATVLAPDRRGWLVVYSRISHKLTIGHPC